MASIKSHFEQRADLDAFWAADVDFAKGRNGLRTTAQDQIRVMSRPRNPSSSASKGLPSEEQDNEEQDTEDSGDAWLKTARTHTPWDFEAVSSSFPHLLGAMKFQGTAALRWIDECRYPEPCKLG